MVKILLTPGTSGGDVARLHAQLQQLNFHIPATELTKKTFGPATQRAVKRFQQQQGLPVTGTVDEETASKLAALASPSPERKLPPLQLLRRATTTELCEASSSTKTASRFLMHTLGYSQRPSAARPSWARPRQTSKACMRSPTSAPMRL